MSWVFRLYDSTIGKKFIMALTGFVLFGFVVIHMLGNLQIFIPGKGKVDERGNAVFDSSNRRVYEHKITEYGHLLKSNPAVLWGARGFLLACVLAHILTMVQLTARNRAARPEPYAMRRWREAIPPARHMALTGIMVGLYIIFHLLHFTTGHMHPSFVDGDVHGNFIRGFTEGWQGPVSALVYVIANILLGMHLAHGAWSMFQSLGIAHPRYTPILKIGARCVAALITLGNISMPILVAVKAVT